ncbi:hypothetical protein AGLY_014881 [Aphis glycines]|uniref:Uncharacterized protein n=1 Tax=Aphis glycines TaxID=307491 RepID=A0A6G0T4J4_APHGL|nr:hypothetical protein AGLY_014881 [Aphis glycines]
MEIVVILLAIIHNYCMNRMGKHFHRTSILIKAFNHKFRLDLELNTVLHKSCIMESLYVVKNVYGLKRYYNSVIVRYNSERSDEYIDFTMMRVITSRNNASVSNFGGVFQWQSEYPYYIEVKNKHFPTVFKKIEKNKKKVTEKREFLRKTSFRSNRFFYMDLKKNQKSIGNTTLKFSISFPSSSYKENSMHHYTKNFNVTTTIYPQTILNICYYSKSISRRYLKISPFFISYSYGDKKIIRIHSTIFFLLAFEVQILTKIRQNHEYLQIILVENNLNFGVFRPLKHKPLFSPTTGNYLLG